MPLLEWLRSLGFGALFGAGLAGLAFTLFPRLFEGATSLRDLLIVGGLIGGGCHRLIESYVIGGVLRPVSAFVTYYARLTQLRFLARLGVVSPRQASDLIKQITEQYFLSARRNDSPRLPPP